MSLIEILGLVSGSGARIGPEGGPLQELFLRVTCGLAAVPGSQVITRYSHVDRIDQFGALLAANKLGRVKEGLISQDFVQVPALNMVTYTMTYLYDRRERKRQKYANPLSTRGA